MKRKMLRLIGCIACFGFCGIALAQTLPPIKIGIIGPVTGKLSEDMGQSIIGGARVFLSDINQVGGIIGRQVILVERDDQAKPEVGVAIAKELIEKEKVVAVVGFGNTGVALPAAKVFQEAKIPVIVTASTGSVVTKSFMPPNYPASYVFRTSASDALQPVAILNDLIDRRKIEKIAILHDQSPYGEFGNQNVVAELKRRNLKPLADESFKIGDTDMSDQLRHIRDSGAQAIVLYCLAEDAATIVKTAEKMQMKQFFVGSWTLSQQSFASKAGTSAEGARTVVTFLENSESSASNQFSLAYYKINKVNRIPSVVAAAQTYDALRLLSLAIYQSNSTDGPELQHALENLDQHITSTIISRYLPNHRPFSSTDHEAISLNMLVMGEIHNGKVVYAYKEDLINSNIKRTKP